MSVQITYGDVKEFLCGVCSDGVGWHYALGIRRCMKCLERSQMVGTDAHVPRWAERAIAELFAWGDGADTDSCDDEASFVCIEHMDSLLRGRSGGKKD